MGLYTTLGGTKMTTEGVRRTLLRVFPALLLSAAALLWLGNARFAEVIAPKAYAEEGAPLTAMAELIKRKGYKDTLTLLCGFDLRKSTKCIIFGLSTGGEERKINPNYPKGWIAAFQTFVEPGTGLTRIILASVTEKGAAGYAFLTDVNGRLEKAAYAPETRTAARQWSIVPITPEIRDIFSRELRLWASEDMQRVVEKEPDKK